MARSPLTLLDAYALTALLGSERASPVVRDLIRDGAAGSPTINIAETAYVLQRRHGLDAARVRRAISVLTERSLKVIPLGETEALRAAELRAGHYHRTRRPLSLADCILLASARAGDRIATADEHVLAVASAQGIETVELPPSGTR